jgi:Fe2+ transport system protein FeoA
MIWTTRKTWDTMGILKRTARKHSDAQGLVPLSRLRKGDRVKICSVPKGLMRAQFLRLGIHEGEQVVCFERLPGGTVVIQKNRQHVALGSVLAKQVFVLVLEQTDD